MTGLPFGGPLSYNRLMAKAGGATPHELSTVSTCTPLCREWLVHDHKLWGSVASLEAGRLNGELPDSPASSFASLQPSPPHQKLRAGPSSAPVRINRPLEL